MKKIVLCSTVVTLIFSLVGLPVGFVFAEDTVPVEPTSEIIVEPTPESEPAPDPIEPEVTLATLPTDGSTEDPISLASSTPLVFEPVEENSIASSSEPIDVHATTTNAATTTNDVAVDALSGDNTASTTDSVVIDTGDAVSNANVLNVVNVNLFNAEAFFAFLNLLGSSNGHADLRDFFNGYDGNLGCSQCSQETTALPPTVAATTTNDSVIDNIVDVNATTGNNEATSTDDVSVDTGNAYANANVVNVANANFVDSKYVLVVLNSFGNWGGDIVLPNESFFDNFLSQSNTTSNSTPPTAISNNNDADMTTSVSTDASSGENTTAASSTGSSSIDTGDAVSGSTVINQANQNFIGGNSIGLVFRVYGNWSGKVFNLPPNLTWNGTPVSIQFLGENGETLGSGGGSLSTDNNTSINNNVSVSASTGNNSASGNNSNIRTGNAYANANIVNIANTNIVGRNWINAIINIFGNWSGNISFGQPNLWLGTRATFENNYTGPDGRIVFEYTIKNNGDAPAHNIKLDHIFGSSLISRNDPGDSLWKIDTLQPGQVYRFTRTAQVAKELPVGYSSISNTITVKADETDGDTRDNTDVVNTVVSFMAGIGYVNQRPITDDDSMSANFTITKTNNASGTVAASSTVDYSISTKNVGGNAKHAIFIDELKDPSGSIIHREEWDLGKVQSQEEIKITYSIFFGASSTPGIYTNTAHIQSADGKFPDSPMATSSVTIGIQQIAPLVKIERPQPIFSTPVIESNMTADLDEATSTATTTPTLTPIIGFTDFSDSRNSSLVANAFSALGSQSWYWYALILMGAGYLAFEQRRIS